MHCHLQEREVHRQQQESEINFDSPAITTTVVEEGENILVVEDEDFVREVTCEVLRSSGYVVLKAKNATQAKELLRKSPAALNLLITDIVLPDQNGCELARDICAANPSLAIIFMSGYPKNVVATHLSQQRQALFLPKPFSANSLLKMVQPILTKANRQ
jgi:DNA-binding NtrC family response regulator